MSNQHTAVTTAPLDLLFDALVEIVGNAEALELEPRHIASVDVAVTRLTDMLRTRYGTAAGNGLALQVGEAFFRRLARQYSVLAGVDDLEFRLLPPGKRTAEGMRLLAVTILPVSKQPAIEYKRGELMVRIKDCPACGSAPSTEPSCYGMVGLLREAMSWFGNGRLYRVQETECRAQGNEQCIFTIPLEPVSD